MFLPLWWRVDPHIWVVSFMRWKGVCYMCLLTEDVNGNLVLLFTLRYWLTVTEYMSHRRQETCSVCRNQSIHPMCRSHNSFRPSFIFHVFFIWNYFSFLDNILKEKLPWEEEYFSIAHILISSICSTNTILVQLFKCRLENKEMTSEINKFNDYWCIHDSNNTCPSCCVTSRVGFVLLNLLFSVILFVDDCLFSFGNSSINGFWLFLFIVFISTDYLTLS
jgi:hypothetical protein